ncbi:uncharacterized protein LOC134805580 [Cydia splendana]|uniref:uncharacterized protein LOC134805580 n=1 Tax=Cydia splendana TaxID=1100963 RepID=UPI00300C7B35
MTSNVLKCNSCNIVINELLAFVQNKVEVMTEDSIIRLCTTAFSSEDIFAKNLLFDSVKTNVRKISRKKDKKGQKNIEDIITLFKELDPEAVPIFVAKDLQKLPSVTFDHIDVTRLLKDILTIQNELNMVKERYATIIIPCASLVNHSESMNFVNVKGAHNILLRKSFDLQNQDSGPFGIINVSNENSLPEPVESTDIVNQSQSVPPSLSHKGQLGTISLPQVEPSVATDLSTVNYARDPVANQVSRDSTADELTSVDAGMDNMHSDEQLTQCKQTFADVLNDGRGWKDEKQDEKWQLVQRNRLGNRFIGVKGKAISNPTQKFKAADVKIALFINNVHKDATNDDITTDIYEKTQEHVQLEKINMNRKKDYNSFKVYVPRHKIEIFMDDNLWPDGIGFRRYIDFRKPLNEANYNK